MGNKRRLRGIMIFLHIANCLLPIDKGRWTSIGFFYYTIQPFSVEKLHLFFPVYIHKLYFRNTLNRKLLLV
jgi:hypothetical protein